MEARTRSGRWLLRIDDLDTPRNIPGATAAIFKTLEAFGLYWDEPVAYQSQHQAAYQQALAQLHAQQLLYRCTCSRKSLSAWHDTAREPVYPNICRDQNRLATNDYALRIKTEASNIRFGDGLQGAITENLATQHGDFILQRKDGIIAYQLAVVIDDHLQAVTHVARGSDLLDSTIKQLYLHQCLKLTPPQYLHVPVITGPQGAKLSKRHFAPAVDAHNNRQILFKLLELLHQNPPPALRAANVSEQLEWALQHWNPAVLQHKRSIDITRF